VIAPRLTAEFPDDQGQIVVLSACSEHLAGVEAHQNSESFDGTSLTIPTEVLERHWQEILHGVQTPVIQMVSTRRAAAG
jgi:hypothetical protein